ncbi:hypothetical protein I7I48_02481 [Histoplasma ohiense]|nr:hypothetical protein I7I48_02481 [Histoplasma ohiense (nom. inval.)]
MHQSASGDQTGIGETFIPLSSKVQHPTSLFLATVLRREWTSCFGSDGQPVCWQCQGKERSKRSCGAL